MTRTTGQERRERCDVAIVGYGPVGACLAGLLGNDGIETRILEREREIYRLPRAVHFDHEVMRTFQALGLRDDDFGYTAPIEGYDFVSGDGSVLFSMPGAKSGLTDQGWRPDYMFHQPDLEGALRSRVEAKSSVQVDLGCVVVGLEERDGGVELEIRDEDTGETRTLLADFVVGCDGANSFVRKASGLELEDLEFDEPWLVVDATVERPPTELGLPEVPTQFCDPARPVTYVPVAGPYIRWEFMLFPDEDRADMLQPAQVEKLIAAQVDPAQVNVIRSAVYDFHALVAKTWGTRRTFIAGDSAHQTPPFLGQGMCAGIRDAANLAWRVSLIVRGLAPLDLLSSYQSERDPHVRTLIGVAVGMGKIICVQDPEAAAARDRQFLEGPSTSPPPLSLPRVGDGFHQGGERGGFLGLQAHLKDAGGTLRLLDDLVGPGFQLLTREGCAANLNSAEKEIVDRFSIVRVELEATRDVNGAYAAWMDKHGSDAILIRPDHIVFGCASGVEAEVRLLAEFANAISAPDRYFAQAL